MTSLWLDTAPPVSADTFVPGGRYDDVIVGAGLTGLITAVLLARAGRSVAVVEARQPGVVTTGNTTGKISVLQGTVVSSIRKNHSAAVARAYVEGNQEGQAWLLHYCGEHGVPVDIRDCFTYATTAAGESAARKELDACRDAGLEVSWETNLELPYAVRGAVKLAGQAQFNSMLAIGALATDLRERGGQLFTGARVTDVHVAKESTVVTDRGEVTATGEVVLATGIPILDRGLYFAKLTPKRSYAVAFRVPGSIPRGMYLSADSTTRSLRTADDGGEERLVIGGNGHTVGREPDTEHSYDDLIAWTQQHFPGAVATHRWSAQDYVSINAVPFVGKLPRGRGHVYLATGYGKWGMSNAPAAALRLAGDILGGSMDWAHVLGTRVSLPHAGLTAVKSNAEVALELAKGWASAELRTLDSTPPAEGKGIVGRVGMEPVAVSTVDGTTCAVSAVCTHLKGIVTWNDAEHSWDCPLHGSRFGADGTVLEGPATAPLEQKSSD